MHKNKTLTNSLGAFIGKAGKVLEKRLAENFAKAGYDLTLEHWIVLVHLWLEDGRNQKTLCEFAGRHKTSITRTLDSLEKYDFVVRIVDKNDRRNKLIYLTNKGKTAREPLSKQLENTMAEATEGVSAEKLNICKEVLGQVFFNLADEEHLRHFAEAEMVSNRTNFNKN